MSGIADVAIRITKEFNVTISSAKEMVGTIMDIIIEMAAEEPVRIGKHSFKTVERKARQGRNPKTGEALTIPARKVVVYKHAKAKTESKVAPTPETKKKSKKK